MRTIHQVLCAFAVVGGLLANQSLAQTSPSTPPAPINDTPEQAEVRKAMVDFAQKLDIADEATLKAAFAGTDEDFKFVKIMNDAFAARKRGVAAVRKAFPEEFAKVRQSDDLTVGGLLREINGSAVTIDGETATIGRGQRGMKLVRKEGVWKASDLVGDATGKGFIGTALPNITKMMNEIAADVEAGKFKSMAEVEQAAQQRMRAAMAGPSTRRASTVPSH